MSILRINALGAEPWPHRDGDSLHRMLDAAAREDGPVTVMIHGFKYRPGTERRCPHDSLFGEDPRSWLSELGFAGADGTAGTAIAFGWNGAGHPRAARAEAVRAGRALARVIADLNRRAPRRALHVIAHSMGVEPALEALGHLPSGSIGRIVSLNGAAYRSRTLSALSTPAGRTAEFVNVTSRENTLFDILYERLVRPEIPGDRAIGFGLDARNAVTLQLHCDRTLTHLARLGAAVDPPARRVCHWSAYTRPGAMRLYADLLRRPERWPLDLIRSGLPDPAPRRRFIGWPGLPAALPIAKKAP